MTAQLILSGQAAVDEMVQWLLDRGTRKVMLVSGERLYEATGARSMVGEALLRPFSVQTYMVSPKLLTSDLVAPCADAMSSFNPEAIVCIGGGSIIDLAKVSRVCWSRNVTADAVIDAGMIDDPLESLIVAVPTTAGTGSESTRFAVVYRGRKKYSIGGASMLPELAVLLPPLLLSMPTSVAVSSGLDALSQAIESYWSIHSTDDSRHNSGEAIRLLTSSLVESASQPSIESRTKVQLAANLAGQAINEAMTTAAHALSYRLTSHFGVPHGKAVFLTLPSVFDFNKGVTDVDCMDTRGADFVRSSLAELAELLGCPDAEAAVEWLRALPGLLDIPSSLAGYGVQSREAIDVVSRGYDANRAGNNPRRLKQVDIVRILESIS